MSDERDDLLALAKTLDALCKVTSHSELERHLAIINVEIGDCKVEIDLRLKESFLHLAKLTVFPTASLDESLECACCLAAKAYQVGFVHGKRAAQAENN